jgi:ATP-dependent helicase/nuclease subunit A
MTKADPKLKRLTNEQFSKTLAERVTGWLNASRRLLIMDGAQLGPLELRDIAILCRTNTDAAQMAGALSMRGLPVSLAESGLLATPEGRLAIACLRRLADPADTLATAEIIALQGSVTPESWLEQRLE